jgi:hypothetical protein
VAGLGVQLWPATADQGVPGVPLTTAPVPMADAVTETIAAFEGDGAHQLLKGAASMVRCKGAVLAPFSKPELLATSGLPGDEVFAVVGGPAGVDETRAWNYLGLARVGKVTVSVFISGPAPTAHAAVEARGNALLASAVARVRTPQVQGLVARYVR